MAEETHDLKDSMMHRVYSEILEWEFWVSWSGASKKKEVQRKHEEEWKNNTAYCGGYRFGSAENNKRR